MGAWKSFVPPYRSCVTGFGCAFKISQRLEPLCSTTFSLLRILGWTPSTPRCEIPDRPQRQVPVCGCQGRACHCWRLYQRLCVPSKLRWDGVQTSTNSSVSTVHLLYHKQVPACPTTLGSPNTNKYVPTPKQQTSVSSQPEGTTGNTALGPGNLKALTQRLKAATTVGLPAPLTTALTHAARRGDQRDRRETWAIQHSFTAVGIATW